MRRTAITIALCNVAMVAIMSALAAYFQTWWISLFSILLMQTIKEDGREEKGM